MYYKYNIKLDYSDNIRYSYTNSFDRPLPDWTESIGVYSTLNKDKENLVYKLLFSQEKYSKVITLWESSIYYFILFYNCV